MFTINKTLSKAIILLSITGCAGSGHYFYDSALNDKNRAPSSLALPEAFEPTITTIDAMRNQAQADFLFLKSEMQSNAGNGAAAIETLKAALVFDPESATFMQKIAIEHYREGKVMQAIVWARKAYEQSPERRDLTLLYAGLLTTTKEFVPAEGLYQKLIAADKTDAEAHLYLGAVYTEQKKFTKALKAFTALEKLPTNSSTHLAHYYKARIHAENNQARQSKDELRKTVALKPDFIEAVLLLGQIIQQTESAQKGFAFYEKHQQQHGPNAKLAEVLSQRYITMGQYDQAYEQLEIVDKAAEGQIQVKLKMSLILIEKKMFDPAISKLNEILELAPDSDKVRFYLSAVYEEKKEFAKAYEEYMKIESDSGYFADARLHAAYLSKIMNKPQRGIGVLKAVLEQKVENPQVFFLLSQLFEETKDFENALHTLKKAKEEFPNHAQVYYFMGAIQDQMDLKDDMLENMQKVVELDSNHAQALNYLAYTWAERGENLEQAEEYARRAVKKAQKDIYILDTLGWVLFKKGQYKQAVEILEKAHALNPSVSIVSEHLGDVYNKLNMNAKAKQQFLRAVENEESVAKQKEIRNKLAQVEDKIKGVRVPSSVEFGLNTDVSP